MKLDKFYRAAEQIEALQRDADRYRFMRDEENWGEDSDVWATLGEMTDVDFDAVVDARMKRSKEEGFWYSLEPGSDTATKRIAELEARERQLVDALRALYSVSYWANSPDEMERAEELINEFDKENTDDTDDT